MSSLIIAAMPCCEGPVIPRIVHAIEGKVAGTHCGIVQLVLDLVRPKEGLGVIEAYAKPSEAVPTSTHRRRSQSSLIIFVRGFA